MGNLNSLIASLVWGSIGLGFAIYGKRQKALAPLLGGVLLMALSYFITSALAMTLAGILLVAAILWFVKYSN